MKENTIEKFVEQGSGFYPRNKEGRGEVLEILWQDGTISSTKIHASSYLKQIVQLFGGDLVNLRKLYGEVIGRKQMVPLPLTYNWVLVPFKMQNPIGRQESIGWFVAQDIVSFRTVGKLLTEIELKRGFHLTCYHSYQFCAQQMRSVTLVLVKFQQLHARRLVNIAEDTIFYHMKKM